MPPTSQSGNPSPRLKHVYEIWWPLAGSWFLMGLELPVVSAVLARLANPEINLAAYAGIVFPLALLIEAPVIMLLAASTALSRNWTTYRVLYRFMWYMAGPLTLVHILVAWTPLYDLVVAGLLGSPPSIIEPARLGLMIMTPWTAAIAIRRFQQGLLIRTGRTYPIGIGTAIRFLSNLIILVIGFMLEVTPGIAVATTGMSCGVLAEACFINWCVRPILSTMKAKAHPGEQAPTFSSLLTFYIPLAMTPLLTLSTLPVLSAALGRMPSPLETLAVWPVIAGLSFTLRSVGLAYQEVVVALMDRPGFHKSLYHFAVLLGGLTTGLFFLIAATPLSHVWFRDISGLSTALTTLGEQAIWLAVLLPGFSTAESLYQGILVHRGYTRGIIESVALSFAIISLILLGGIAYSRMTGLFVGLAAVICGTLVQLLWLRFRCHHAPPH